MVFFIEEFDFEKKTARAAWGPKSMDLGSATCSSSGKNHETSTQRACRVRDFDDMIENCGVCVMSNEMWWNERPKKMRKGDVISSNTSKVNRIVDEMEVDGRETRLHHVDLNPNEKRGSMSICTWTSSS